MRAEGPAADNPKCANAFAPAQSKGTELQPQPTPKE